MHNIVSYVVSLWLKQEFFCPNLSHFLAQLLPPNTIGFIFSFQIITIKKLGTHYKSYERRKQLAGAYDVFLADNRIFSLLFKKLGKAFLFKRGPPFPVNLSKPNLKAELNAAITSTHYRTSDTTSLSVRIGRLSMSSEDLLQNCLAVTKYLGKHVPKGWKEVKVLYIKTVTSVSLPVYNSLT